MEFGIENVRNGPHELSGNERKKSNTQENEKTSWNQTTKEVSHQSDKRLDCFSGKGTWWNWTREELQQMGQRSGKFRTMHKA